MVWLGLWLKYLDYFILLNGYFYSFLSYFLFIDLLLMGLIYVVIKIFLFEEYRIGYILISFFIFYNLFLILSNLIWLFYNVI